MSREQKLVDNFYRDMDTEDASDNTGQGSNAWFNRLGVKRKWLGFREKLLDLQM